ncbi:mercuric transport protein MerTP [Salinimicrobium sp. CDJ15-81-2]|jgi:copper chaperone CopZ|uniref:Mercuric transport protein MerT n=2 Tax=Flavobacteriaceae TaxID=49546 RepID=A0ABU3CL54_9FLAO|nr:MULTISPECIES: mercuric transport protein MerTP [Flavobacteriaceae]MDT0647077.1 mercuric transport protein MerTP [Zunongwangia sp. F260]NJW52156.1 mercuric transport protein MerTP [Salinimicrobium oceani]NJY63519.1 mercuric transport protein MerTP [Salinimicrobium nanhaiense]
MDASQNRSNKAALSGVVAATAASLCCIAPVLALVVGTSGMATTFSWMEPFRPYLIALTVLVLGLAWYQKLRSKKEAESDCGCAEDEKPTFLQSKKFLLIVTLFAGLMLAFPTYSEVFYSQPTKEIVYVSQSNIVKEVFVVEGMTCAGCEAPVENEVNKLDGIISVKANYENANTVVEYDKTKVDKAAIISAISSTGYKVVDK